MNKKTIFLNVALLVVSLVIAVVSVEASFRVWAKWTGWTRSVFNVGGSLNDKRLGWRIPPNRTFESIETDLGGVQYPVKFSTDELGFRLTGSMNSSKKKILIVGDSFTAANSVSDDKTYFYFLAQRLPEYELFAHGTPGHGTLQELFVLEELLEIVKPDLIILQFCSNDIINNHYELEVRSYQNNNHHRRPYYDLDGRLFYATPFTSRATQLARLLASQFGQYFNILYFLHDRILIKEADLFQSESIEKELWNKNQPPLITESLDITDRLVSQIKQKVGKTPLYAFSVDDERHTMEISLRHKIKWIEGVNHAIVTAERNGEITKHSDGGHWNNHGNEIAAEVIYRYFVEHGLTLPFPKTDINIDSVVPSTQ